MNTKSYDRNTAINYAKKWALSRNPKYYNVDAVGGDCTSFVSQNEIKAGDIAQLSFSGQKFEHSLFIIDPFSLSVAAHTYDVLGKKINEYNFSKVRFVHIVDVGM